jgi:ribose transport system substrate-binding protein
MRTLGLTWRGRKPVCSWALGCVLLSLSGAIPAQAGAQAVAQAQNQAPSVGKVFGLSGKRVDDPVFITVWRGCEDEARKQGDQCVHLGQPGPANARAQDDALAAHLKHHSDGIAVSVTHAGFLATHALKAAQVKGVPIVTFDSDLDELQRGMRRSYVGPDNVRFGLDLGQLAKRRWPQGGIVCLMSADPHDPNLQARLRGVRQALSGDPRWPSGQLKLTGQGAWTESPRCPWFNGDSQDRALKQLGTSLQDPRVDVLISVGAWPLLNLQAYAALVRRIQVTRPDAGQRVFVGTGTSTPQELQLLHDGLIGGLAAIDFETMGRQAYLALKRISLGEAVEPVIRTGATLHPGGGAFHP